MKHQHGYEPIPELKETILEKGGVSTSSRSWEEILEGSRRGFMQVIDKDSAGSWIRRGFWLAFGGLLFGVCLSILFALAGPITLAALIELSKAVN